ncbi:MAG: peptidylprolyl isomerase [Gammaproteobacteria bacterium]|nr:peptidylprolyl isomerase [Gammaproteobacteria bacterium]
MGVSFYASMVRWFDGSTEFGNFGSSITGAGDVNSDGFADIVVGDPSFELFNGRIFVFSGIDGAELWRVDDTVDSVSFGSAVASTADITGDGVADVLVGDPNGAGLSGSVFLLSGADGTLLLRIDGAGGGFGRSLSSAGDINADQVADIIVGARDADPGDLTSAGSVFAIALTEVRDRTIVQVSTTLGNFSIELFDEITPITVANFLSYVNSGAYNGTFVHRSEPGFVIQGGWLVFDEPNNVLNPIAITPGIENEPGISNIRGTLAMAKVDGDPNSATSQWFVNLADNSANLDVANGGFTVFARVLSNGMDVVDTIAALPRATLVPGQVDNAPVINFSGNALTSANLVELTMSVVQATVDGPNTFDNATGLLNVSVDAGVSGLFSLSFSLFSSDPETVIQAQADTVVSLSQTVAKIATFNDTSGQLIIPELVIDGTVAFRNIVFQLSDAENLLFTLISFD